MPVKLSKKEVDDMFATAKMSNAKPAHFADYIEKLKDGEGIMISKAEWEGVSKVALPTYYRSKYNVKNENDFLEIKKVGEDYLLKKNLAKKPAKPRVKKS